jgi:oxygen-independent coproporphyrinogen III oxidase
MLSSRLAKPSLSLSSPLSLPLLPAAGLYVHVPFCQSRCLYCDFYLELSKYGGIPAFEEALLKELEQRFKPVAHLAEPLHSIYFGGGTPSLLSPQFYKRFFKRLKALYPIHPNAEITLEVNPCDLAGAPEAYREAGFNRISLGVQSLQNEELKRLSRRHNAEQAYEACLQLRAAGFTNLSVDLMYGLPSQTLESWQETLQSILTWPVEHLSIYGLQLEAGTALAKLVQKGVPRYQLPDADWQADAFACLKQTLPQAGFICYELSNWAKQGYESQHNLGYWNNRPYWALGPAAHGYLHPWRYSNKADLNSYLQDPLCADLAFCSDSEAWENVFVFGLRQPQGVCLTHFEERYGQAAIAKVKPVIECLLKRQWLEQKGTRVSVPEALFYQANAVLAEFVGL